MVAYELPGADCALAKTLDYQSVLAAHDEDTPRPAAARLSMGASDRPSSIRDVSWHVQFLISAACFRCESSFGFRAACSRWPMHFTQGSYQKIQVP